MFFYSYFRVTVEILGGNFRVYCRVVLGLLEDSFGVTSGLLWGYLWGCYFIVILGLRSDWFSVALGIL